MATILLSKMISSSFSPAKDQDLKQQCCQTCRCLNQDCIQDSQSQDAPIALCCWDYQSVWVSIPPAIQGNKYSLLGSKGNIKNFSDREHHTKHKHEYNLCLPCTLGQGSWVAPTLHPYPHPSLQAFQRQGLECFQVYPSSKEEQENVTYIVLKVNKTKELKTAVKILERRKTFLQSKFYKQTPYQHRQCLQSRTTPHITLDEVEQFEYIYK